MITCIKDMVASVGLVIHLYLKIAKTYLRSFLLPGSTFDVGNVFNVAILYEKFNIK